MNYVISIIDPKAMDVMDGICTALKLPMAVVLMGHGTAVRSMLDLLGIESNEKRVVLIAATEEKTKELITELKRRLFIGIPGHGIVVSVPIKSIGGGNTVAYLSGGQKPAKHTPELNFAYELIVAIANEGRTDMVMNAARAAGATGGTVLHGKGTGDAVQEKFLNVSIGSEKEIILIVAKASQKSAIMKSVLQSAGPNTEAGTIIFSLPTSEVAGFGMFDSNE